MNIFGLSITRAVKDKTKAMQTVPGAGGWWPVIREPFTGAWQRNMELKGDDLLRSPIVYACITLIANDIAKLGWAIEELNDSTDVWEDIIVPAYTPLLTKPNRYQSPLQFRHWWIMSKLRFGNSYALKQRDGRGVVVALYLLDPCRVTPLVSDDGSVFYQCSSQDNLAGIPSDGVVIPASEIIHDRTSPLFHPLVGISPLYAAAISAGTNIRIQDNAAFFFGNSSMPSGVLIAPGELSDEDARALKAAWEAGYTGGNAGKVAILGDGMRFEPMRQTASDSQMVENLRWNDEQVCAVFHVPAYKVGVGTVPGNANVEALAQDYYSQCLQIHIEEMESCMDEGLGLDGMHRRFHLDLRGLIRMDSKTQMEALGLGVDRSIYTINNARRAINLPPLPGGDTVYMQQQDIPLDVAKDNTLPEPAPAPALPAPVDTAADPEQNAADETKALLDYLRKGMADA